MRVWITRRRGGGVLLPEPEALGTSPGPLELLVVDGSDQGQRRPGKLARVYAPGTKAILYQLESPRLVWCKAGHVVLSGTEVLGVGSDRLYGHQTWLCRWALPPAATGLRGRVRYERGVVLPHRKVMDRYATVTRGELSVHSVWDESLGRHTMWAQWLNNPAAVSLRDCELDFMGEETFQLSGYEQHETGPYGPARLLRQSWLCDFDLPAAPSPTSYR